MITRTRRERDEIFRVSENRLLDCKKVDFQKKNERFFSFRQPCYTRCSSSIELTWRRHAFEWIRGSKMCYYIVNEYYSLYSSIVQYLHGNMCLFSVQKNNMLRATCIFTYTSTHNRHYIYTGIKSQFFLHLYTAMILDFITCKKTACQILFSNRQ